MIEKVENMYLISITFYYNSVSVLSQMPFFDWLYMLLSIL